MDLFLGGRPQQFRMVLNVKKKNCCSGDDIKETNIWQGVRKRARNTKLWYSFLGRFINLVIFPVEEVKAPYSHINSF